MRTLMGMRARTSVLDAVANDVAAGHIEAVVGQTLALEAFRDADGQAASSAVLGNVVLIMEEAS